MFVEELSECPTDRPVVFSAHGVPKSVPEEAERRQMIYVDATCPLVTRVHNEAKVYSHKDFTILLVGHRKHVEIEGVVASGADLPFEDDSFDVVVLASVVHLVPEPGPLLREADVHGRSFENFTANVGLAHPFSHLRKTVR